MKYKIGMSEMLATLFMISHLTMDEYSEALTETAIFTGHCLIGRMPSFKCASRLQVYMLHLVHHFTEHAEWDSPSQLCGSS
jgi:hypothetical protein